MKKSTLAKISGFAILASGGSAFADDTGVLDNATSVISGFSAPVTTAAIAVIGVFAIFCLVKLGKKILSLV